MLKKKKKNQMVHMLTLALIDKTPLIINLIKKNCISPNSTTRVGGEVCIKLYSKLKKKNLFILKKFFFTSTFLLAKHKDNPNSLDTHHDSISTFPL